MRLNHNSGDYDPHLFGLITGNADWVLVLKLQTVNQNGYEFQGMKLYRGCSSHERLPEKWGFNLFYYRSDNKKLKADLFQYILFGGFRITFFNRIMLIIASCSLLWPIHNFYYYNATNEDKVNKKQNRNRQELERQKNLHSFKLFNTSLQQLQKIMIIILLRSFSASLKNPNNFIITFR